MSREDILSHYAHHVMAKYNDASSKDFANFLIYGDYGTGKTQSISTAPRPIWIHSFDNGGLNNYAIRELIQSGDCFADTRFEGDGQTNDWENAYIYDLWEKEIESMQKMGIFDHIGTFAIDSFSRFSDAMMNKILCEGKRAGMPPSQPNYLRQQLMSVEILTRLCALPCHIVITGHIQKWVNDVQNKVETAMLLYGKLAEKVPIQIDERYIALVSEKGNEAEYHFLTRHDGIYRASTRIGGGKFPKFIPQDIRAALKRANKSWEDRPRIIPSTQEDYDTWRNTK